MQRGRRTTTAITRRAQQRRRTVAGRKLAIMACRWQRSRRARTTPKAARQSRLAMAALLAACKSVAPVRGGSRVDDSEALRRKQIGVPAPGYARRAACAGRRARKGFGRDLAAGSLTIKALLALDPLAHSARVGKPRHADPHLGQALRPPADPARPAVHLGGWHRSATRIRA